MNLIKQLEAEQTQKFGKGKADVGFEPGDTLKVNVKVVEESKDEKSGQIKRRDALLAAQYLFRNSAPRPRPSRQALLSQRPNRQSGAHHRTRPRPQRRCGGRACGGERRFLLNFSSRCHGRRRPTIHDFS